MAGSYASAGPVRAEGDGELNSCDQTPERYVHVSPRTPEAFCPPNITMRPITGSYARPPSLRPDAACAQVPFPVAAEGDAEPVLRQEAVDGEDGWHVSEVPAAGPAPCASEAIAPSSDPDATLAEGKLPAPPGATIAPAMGTARRMTIPNATQDRDLASWRGPETRDHPDARISQREPGGALNLSLKSQSLADSVNLTVRCRRVPVVPASRSELMGFPQ